MKKKTETEKAESRNRKLFRLLANPSYRSRLNCELLAARAQVRAAQVAKGAAL